MPAYPGFLAYNVSDTVRSIFRRRSDEIPKSDYCRQPREYTRLSYSIAKKGPWCVVKDASGNYTEQLCDVPYCADASKYFVPLFYAC